MTAQDLLVKYLDYQSFWASDHVAGELPAKVRLQQLEILLQAFDIKKNNVNPRLNIRYIISGDKNSRSRTQYLADLSDLEYFASGEFLRDRPYEQYAALTDQVSKVMENLFPSMGEYRRSKPEDLRWLFTDLLSFRLDVYKLTRPAGGMLEGFSSGLYYSHFLQARLKAVINDNLEEIDETLCLLIDPAQQEIDITHYQYPDVDLEEIDHKWRMENY